MIGMALQEEKQHLENLSEENVVTFTFTQKISSMSVFISIANFKQLKMLVPYIPFVWNGVYGRSMSVNPSKSVSNIVDKFKNCFVYLTEVEYICILHISVAVMVDMVAAIPNLFCSREEKSRSRVIPMKSTS